MKHLLELGGELVIASVVAAVAHASRPRLPDGRTIDESPPPDWPELKRPPNDNELL